MFKRLFILVLIPFISFSQDIEYAKEVVKTLCSDEFKGRGYVGNGDKIAANFISKEFEKIGLQKFENLYFQKYTTPVNSFPSNMDLSINGTKLIAGKDFLIGASSPSLKGSFEVVSFSPKEILNKKTLIKKLKNSIGKVIVINTYNKTDFSAEENKKLKSFSNLLRKAKDNPAVATIFLTKDKLTWTGSTTQSTKVNFTVTDLDFGDIENVEINVTSKFFKKYKSQNIIGFLEGKNTDSSIVFVAHYDHLGMMGTDAIFPGANDNASGVAMLLSIAKYYKANKPKYNTYFIAFGSEEIGLVGAKYFIENTLFDIKKIKFLINFDITGTGDDGIQVVNGSIYKKEFELLKSINKENDYMKEIKTRGAACNSDHCVFDERDVPCFFIYTLGGTTGAYHDIYDKAETLPLTDFEDYYRLIVAFIRAL